MFKIGEFSKFAQVSIRLLRHYDDMDLLKPAHVDWETNYRYYTIDQLPWLNRILALKDLGLSLNQVGRLLDDNITPQEIRGMLLLKKAQIEQVIDDERMRLTRVESRLKEIEAHGQLSEYAPLLKSVPEQPYLFVREVTPNEAAMSEIIFKSYAALRKNDIPPGLSTAHFYSIGHQDIDIDWAYGFVTEEDVPHEIQLDDGRTMVSGSLPAVETMVSVMHRGSFIDLHRGYSAIGRWLDSNYYRICGYGREVFLRLLPPSQDQDNLTEIQFPVEYGPSEA